MRSSASNCDNSDCVGAGKPRERLVEALHVRRERALASDRIGRQAAVEHGTRHCLEHRAARGRHAPLGQARPQQAETTSGHGENCRRTETEFEQSSPLHDLVRDWNPAECCIGRRHVRRGRRLSHALENPGPITLQSCVLLQRHRHDMSADAHSILHHLAHRRCGASPPRRPPRAHHARACAEGVSAASLLAQLRRFARRRPATGRRRASSWMSSMGRTTSASAMRSSRASCRRSCACSRGRSWPPWTRWRSCTRCPSRSTRIAADHLRRSRGRRCRVRGAHGKRRAAARRPRDADRTDPRGRRVARPLTRNPLLRHTLRLMRGPARAAGLGELQRFLESGFDTFKAMGGAREFLSIIAARERALARALVRCAAPAGWTPR